jgi:hypothetical protein
MILITSAYTVIGTNQNVQEIEQIDNENIKDTSPFWNPVHYIEANID